MRPAAAATRPRIGNSDRRCGARGAVRRGRAPTAAGDPAGRWRSGRGLGLRAGVLDAYQVARFTAFLDPGADPQGVGYNVQQALIAIGTGGVSGQGLLSGVHTQGAFVPYQYTDFIFSAVGEELGMLGGLLVIGLFVGLLYRAATAALHADRFGALLATGVVCWLGAQGFENLGMNLGLLPVTGAPAAGVVRGSSVIAAWIGVGLVPKVSRR